MLSTDLFPSDGRKRPTQTHYVTRITSKLLEVSGSEVLAPRSMRHCVARILVPYLNVTFWFKLGNDENCSHKRRCSAYYLNWKANKIEIPAESKDDVAITESVDLGGPRKRNLIIIYLVFHGSESYSCYTGVEESHINLSQFKTFDPIQRSFLPSQSPRYY